MVAFTQQAFEEEVTTWQLRYEVANVDGQVAIEALRKDLEGLGITTVNNKSAFTRKIPLAFQAIKQSRKLSSIPDGAPPGGSPRARDSPARRPLGRQAEPGVSAAWLHFGGRLAA